MMFNKKTTKLTISAISFIIGIFMLINSQSNIAGAVIGVTASTNSVLSSFLGIIFIILSIFLLATTISSLEQKVIITSTIKRYPALLRLTKEAVKNQTVEKELNYLIKELSKGNFEAGLGNPGHIRGTDVYYLRGRSGARLYYRRIGENHYEIVAKSGKGRNQDQAINILEEIYGN